MLGLFPSITLALASTSGPAHHLPEPVPVLEIIKIYGSLADRTCYGKTSPVGSSCQLPLPSLKEKLGLVPSEKNPIVPLTRDEFISKVNSYPFSWPLKPYGREKSLSKTSIMNKGAETYIYMDELERRGLFDRHDPTGPLPTSLRPKLNSILNEEGVSKEAGTVVFDTFVGGNGIGGLTSKTLDEVFGEQDIIDYYGFLDLIGTDSIIWR